MSSSGGIKFDFTAAYKLVPGEHRVLRFVCNDANGDPVSSFSGWTFAFYLLPTQRTALDSTDVLLTKTSGGGGISATVPNIDVTLTAANTGDLDARPNFYELWRTDSGNEVRLAYGSIVFID